jgi:predicted RNA-binding protein with PUA-like domain
MAKRAREYWLMKSEPDAFGIEDLERKGREPWDGVRNYQARNFMRAMQQGDLVLFYHSNAKPPGVAGVAEIVEEAHADPTQFDPKSKYYDPKSAPADPRWSLVDVSFVERFTDIVGLDVLKAEPSLTDMLVVQKGSRLSVQPVTKTEFKTVLAMAKAKTKVR